MMDDFHFEFMDLSFQKFINGLLDHVKCFVISRKKEETSVFLN